MEFGVCIPNKIDEVGIAAYAENLGYSHAWITDTQMIFRTAGPRWRWRRVRPAP